MEIGDPIALRFVLAKMAAVVNPTQDAVFVLQATPVRIARTSAIPTLLAWTAQKNVLAP